MSVVSDYDRITSPHNSRLKNVIRLRQRRGRERQQRILIDGLREIDRAIQAGVELQELFVAETFWESQAESLLESLATQTQIVLLPDPLLDRIGYGERNEGLVAVATPPARSLEQLDLPTRPLVAVLEGVEKPGNVGAVVRSADAAGLDAVVVVDGVTDLYNPNAIRASLGTLFSVPICATTSQALMAWLERMKLRVVVTRVDGAGLYDECDYREGTAIVLGSEANGVSQLWKAESFDGIKLPMQGVADSLNVSATAAVIFYEANRQRRSTVTSN